MNECERVAKRSRLRTWFVVFKHVIRQPASSTSGHREEAGLGQVLPAGKSKGGGEVSEVSRRRSTLAGWRTFRRFFEM